MSWGLREPLHVVEPMVMMVPYAQPQVKTGLSATACGGFGLDMGLGTRSLTTKSSIARE
jgi:hypothetical protein